MRKIKKIGDLCRRCNTPVILKESKFKESKLKKAYYFTGYFFCPTCKAMYMSVEFQVWNRKSKKRKKVYCQKPLYTVKELKEMDYGRYLKTGHWNRIKKEYWKKHKKICFCCNLDAYVLHHIEYKNRGREKDKDLIPLCEECHNEIHTMILN